MNNLKQTSKYMSSKSSLSKLQDITELDPE